MLQEIENVLVASIKSDLAYNVDLSIYSPLQVTDYPREKYPLCVLDWGLEEDEGTNGEDVPAGYFQSDVELVLRVIPYCSDAELRQVANQERTRLKKWVADNLQFHPAVIELYYIRSEIGRFNPDGRPCGGLEFVVGVKYRQLRANPEKC